ncbi:LytTR family DNA-binding domain-containing protein [Ruminococcus sp. XPD3002]|uniref:LytR/AlgR family response regulator transcription factor n=1 Tax=Ruminococcus sp. XPD3002 TaxID=1452269 RepID=UPI00091935D1|nr:response regulator transcription factor [Ruminococcus sp.]SFX96366.1 two component transcriptional regulator, LytTR family [Ruminococcus flavefaciens]HPY84462.1 LytTR family DNA-binding domain-containing protein [Ruminococcus flavefaciens]HRU98251.1 LytTR family DNA-binding domain-containing protein [Ruminococcus sp.]
MKIAICDDEQIFRDTLYKKLVKYNKTFEIKEFRTGRELIDSRIKFDIIFLDIEMPELNGMDTAKKLRKLSVGSIIIFLTSHIECIQDAFKVKAFRFLSKPVQEDALNEALEEAEKEIVGQEKIVINQKGKIFELSVPDVMYFEAFGDGTYVYDNKDNVYECTVALKEWDKRLEGMPFFKIHKSYIVSMMYVSSINNNVLRLEGVDQDFTISRRNITPFKDAYMDFVKNNSRVI